MEERKESSQRLLAAMHGEKKDVEMEGWLTKTRKNLGGHTPSSMSLFAAKRYFKLKGHRLSWHDANHKLLGDADVGGATVEHPTASTLVVTYATGRRDELRVEPGATPTAKQWVVALRTVALRASAKTLPGTDTNNRRKKKSSSSKLRGSWGSGGSAVTADDGVRKKREIVLEKAPREEESSFLGETSKRKVFVVKKFSGAKRVRVLERRVEVRNGVLYNSDLAGRVKSQFRLFQSLTSVEKSRFVPQQLVLKWRDHPSFRLEFRTIGDADAFYDVLHANRSGHNAVHQKRKRRVKKPKWLRIRVCTWNVGNRQPSNDLSSWLRYPSAGVTDRALDDLSNRPGSVTSDDDDDAGVLSPDTSDDDGRSLDDEGLEDDDDDDEEDVSEDDGLGHLFLNKTAVDLDFDDDAVEDDDDDDDEGGGVVHHQEDDDDGDEETKVEETSSPATDTTPCDQRQAAETTDDPEEEGDAEEEEEEEEELEDVIVVGFQEASYSLKKTTTESTANSSEDGGSSFFFSQWKSSSSSSFSESNNNAQQSSPVMGGKRARNDREDLVRLVSQSFEPGGYVLTCEEAFWEMRLMVFVKKRHARYASTVDVDRKGCGIADTLGNKGAIGAALSLYDTTLCFVSCHLKANQMETQGRNEDFRQIVESLKLGRPELDCLSQFDHVFWFGDLNYRVDLPEALFFAEEAAASLTRPAWDPSLRQRRTDGQASSSLGVQSFIIEDNNRYFLERSMHDSSNHNLAPPPPPPSQSAGGGGGGDSSNGAFRPASSKPGLDDAMARRDLLRRMRQVDQLDGERAAGRAFWGFEEAASFDFPPTYRFERSSRRREPGERRKYTPNRMPSWCDRVLWKTLPGVPRVVQTLLASVDDDPDLDTSDHAPLVATFALRRAHPFRRRREEGRVPPEQRNALTFTALAATGAPGLAPFHYRKPSRCALRVFGRYVDAHATDFATSAECLAPCWSPADVPPVLLSPTATFQALRSSALSVQLVDDKHRVLGTAVLSLKDVCDRRGGEWPFTAWLAYRGVTCGQLSGVLVAKGPAFFSSSSSSSLLNTGAAEE